MAIGVIHFGSCFGAELYRSALQTQAPCSSRRLTSHPTGPGRARPGPVTSVVRALCMNAAVPSPIAFDGILWFKLDGSEALIRIQVVAPTRQRIQLGSVQPFFKVLIPAIETYLVSFRSKLVPCRNRLEMNLINAFLKSNRGLSSRSRSMRVRSLGNAPPFRRNEWLSTRLSVQKNQKKV
jgi:hypothetical protein